MIWSLMLFDDVTAHELNSENVLCLSFLWWTNHSKVSFLLGVQYLYKLFINSLTNNTLTDGEALKPFGCLWLRPAHTYCVVIVYIYWCTWHVDMHKLKISEEMLHSDEFLQILPSAELQTVTFLQQDGQWRVSLHMMM